VGPDSEGEGGASEVSRVEDYVWEGAPSRMGEPRPKVRLGNMADAHLEHALNSVRTWATKLEHKIEEMVEGDSLRRMRGRPTFFDENVFVEHTATGPRFRSLRGPRREVPVGGPELLHEINKAKIWWEWERRFLLEIKRRRGSGMDRRGPGWDFSPL
jgi:hypothetical protein